MEKHTNCFESCLLPSDNEMIACNGNCNNCYHPICVGLSSDDNRDEWVCQLCQNVASDSDALKTTLSQELAQMERNLEGLFPIDPTLPSSQPHSLTQLMEDITCSQVEKAFNNVGLPSSSDTAANNPTELVDEAQQTNEIARNNETSQVDRIEHTNQIDEAEEAGEEQVVHTCRTRLEAIEEQYQIERTKRLEKEAEGHEPSEEPLTLSIRKRRPLREEQQISSNIHDHSKRLTVTRNVPLMSRGKPTEPITDDESDETSVADKTIDVKKSRRTKKTKKTTKTGKPGTNLPDDSEYEIEEIVGHEYDENGIIYYETKWKGYPSEQNTLELETSFVNAYKTLLSYKMNANLGEPTIKRRKGWGALNTLRINPSIWKGAEDIIQEVKRYLTLEHRDLLKIKVLKQGDPLERQDQIYLIDQGNHVLVGLHQVGENSITLADGGNAYLEDQEVRDWIKTWIQVPIRVVKFPNQTKVDHCASSAAVICIRFIQCYATRMPIWDPLVAPKTWQAKIAKSMHNGPSQTLITWKPVQENVIKYRCSFQGCEYYSRKRDHRQLTAHMLKHRSKASD